MRASLQGFMAVMAIGTATTAAILIRTNLARQESTADIGSADLLKGEPGKPLELTELQPHPALSPALVVRHHVAALRAAAEHDELAWRAAYRLASPANRDQIGSLSDFAAIFATPTFSPLVNCEAVSFGPSTIFESTRASQDVQVSGAGGAAVLYRFFLSLQEGPLYDGCWMIDGVVRLEVPKGASASRQDGIGL